MKASKKKLAYIKAWKKANPEKVKAYSKKHHRKFVETHRDWVRAYKRRWSKMHPEYRTWHCMNERCNNPKKDNYRNYGGRGIRVLYKSFREFAADVGPKPSSKYSIDRIDNNGNYDVGNCRWATAKQQKANRRNTVVRMAA